MSNLRVYFPNLNSIRFIAALAVMIHHIELTKYWFGQPNIYTSSFVGGVFGQLGIILFFVLSGFLITYLLLLENRETGKISVKNFYIRRILRIWPLYYFIVILGLFILPHIQALAVPGYTEDVYKHFVPKALMFFSFFPNLAYSVYKHVPYAEQSWSVGVEEQFYLMWPFLISLVIRKKKTINMLLGVIAFYVLIKIVAIILYTDAPDNKTIQTFYQFWVNFCIDCMAIGGIAACILFYKKEKLLKALYNKYLQLALYIIVVVVTIKGFSLPHFFTYEMYAVIFAVLIINLASNVNTVLNFENKPMSYLGKISYGLYMYHNVIAAVCLQVVLFLDISLAGIWGNCTYYFFVIATTIIIASVSYEFFEKRFIKAKLRYSKVISGENALEYSKK
ncbi:MAG: acyltransferase [Bacteroidetes bacterium]|nr:acyltransferase [Bacteroidota bacterium]